MLMLFRCGFAPELVLTRELQRCFARGYLGEGCSEEDVEGMLLTMHLWAYFGMLKMGLLCAVLMSEFSEFLAWVQLARRVWAVFYRRQSSC